MYGAGVGEGLEQILCSFLSTTLIESLGQFLHEYLGEST